MNRHEDVKNEEASYQAFAVSKTDSARRFRVELRSGASYSISYSTLPIFILTAEKQLIIKAYELLITIDGRNLQKMAEALNNETLIYLKESPSKFDDGQGLAFIENISIAGDTLIH